MSTNFPPPSGVADEIIAKAIELLARDEWEELHEKYVVIRDVFFTRENANIRISRDGSEVLRWGKPAAAYRDAFKEAFSAAVEREREKRLGPVLAQIGDDKRAQRLARKNLRDGALAISAIGVGVLSIAGLVAWGITSATAAGAQASAAEEARANEVNEYGYKRGAIFSRKTWPDDCAHSGYTYQNVENPRHYSFDSIYECKSMWKRWERDGEVWVDWKQEP